MLAIGVIILGLIALCHPKAAFVIVMTPVMLYLIYTGYCILGTIWVHNLRVVI